MRLTLDLAPTLADALEAHRERIGAATITETLRALIRETTLPGGPGRPRSATTLGSAAGHARASTPRPMSSARPDGSIVQYIDGQPVVVREAGK